MILVDVLYVVQTNVKHYKRKKYHTLFILVIFSRETLNYESVKIKKKLSNGTNLFQVWPKTSETF